LTRTVIETLEPKTVHAGDADADEAEVRLLNELGFDSLLMLAIRAEEGAWGLVEVYGDSRRFGDADVDVARNLADEAADMLLHLSRPVQ
ncbi:MAG TPA: GAF domain-containing protein, partial [Gaiellaceae bacterium]|nr:GAF domain-containing protein [Gaiellaceae bacterium]